MFEGQEDVYISYGEWTCNFLQIMHIFHIFGHICTYFGVWLNPLGIEQRRY